MSTIIGKLPNSIEFLHTTCDSHERVYCTFCLELIISAIVNAYIHEHYFVGMQFYYSYHMFTASIAGISIIRLFCCYMK